MVNEYRSLQWTGMKTDEMDGYNVLLRKDWKAL